MSRHWIPATENVSDLGLTEKPFDRLSRFVPGAVPGHPRPARRPTPPAGGRFRRDLSLVVSPGRIYRCSCPPLAKCRPGPVGCAAPTTAGCHRKKRWTCKV